MIPTWILEKFESDETFNRLKHEITIRGMSVIQANYLSFVSDNSIIPKAEPGQFTIFRGSQFTIFHGSLALAQEILRKRADLVPGAWCNLKQFKCSSYYPRLGKHLLNENYVFLPVHELKRKKKWIYDNFGTNNKVFVRPDSGFKEFIGSAIDFEDFDNEVDLMEAYSSMEFLAVVSTPKSIRTEYRFVVSENRVVAGSTYLMSGELHCRTIDENDDFDMKCIRSVSSMLSGLNWLPDPMYVVDVCLDEYGEYKIIELNSFSCSDFYACDMSKIVSEAVRIGL